MQNMLKQRANGSRQQTQTKSRRIINTKASSWLCGAFVDLSEFGVAKQTSGLQFVACPASLYNGAVNALDLTGLRSDPSIQPMSQAPDRRRLATKDLAQIHRRTVFAVKFRSCFLASKHQAPTFQFRFLPMSSSTAAVRIRIPTKVQTAE